MPNASIGFSILLLLFAPAAAMAQADAPPASGGFRIELPPHPLAGKLLPDSPFGINTALNPDTPDLAQRLRGFQQAGIKWGRQDFTWPRIEKEPGKYDFAGYDRLVEQLRQHGVLVFGDLTSAPKFHDPRTPEGVRAYCAFAAEAARRYRGKVDHWQIWNEPNGGYWKGTPEQYAALLSAAGKAIHEANPDAKVLALNMAFCDVRWAERVLALVPGDAFDIACFHPYRAMCAPEEKLDWWMRDQYVKSWNAKSLDDAYPLIRMDFLQQTQELVKVMEKLDKRRPLWVTEICWNTNIHPYGTPELRQADMLVRFHVLAIASRTVEKVFWWTYRDVGDRQFDMADMVGLVRANHEPKYAFYAYATMTRMLEGRKWLANLSMGPDVYAIAFRDEQAAQDTIVAWSAKPYAYIRVSNSEKGLTFHDVFGTRRFVPFDKVRTGSLPVALGESPIYITGPVGTKIQVRADPGW